MGFTAFLDFEFSQGSSFPKEEIISIGCVFYDNNMKEIDSFYSLVKPTINRRISPRITRITKIKQTDINNAPSFFKVMNTFIKKIKQYPEVKFYSWGNDDWKVFKDECDVNKCVWMRKYIPEITDLQIEIFNSIKNENKKLLNTPKNLTITSLFYNVEQLEAHNALNDAKMLAQVYKTKKERGSYDYSIKKFENMNFVSETSMKKANDIAHDLKTKEKRIIMTRFIKRFGNDEKTKLLDGNVYHIIEPYLDEPLFTKRKHRKYADYTVHIKLDESNMLFCIKICSINKEIIKRFDIEEYHVLTRCLFNIFSGNKRRQKNWNK